MTRARPSIAALTVCCGALCGMMLAPGTADAGLAPAASPSQKSIGPANAARQTQSVFEKEQQMSPAQLLKRWKPIVAKASLRFGVPVAWINAVMRLESGGRTMLTENQRMVSDKGAMGIMQVMPGTYQQMREQYKFGPDPYDPEDNIHAGTAYLKWLKGKYGYPAMFAAYNSGPGQVDDLLARGMPLPPETRAYVAGIGKILDGAGGPDGASVSFATLTRPDGSPVFIDPVAVRSIRDALPGEYAPGVNAVINMGVLKQGVREDAATATAAIRIRGGKL